MEILGESLPGRWKQQVQRPKWRKNLTCSRRGGEEWKMRSERWGEIMYCFIYHRKGF